MKRFNYKSGHIVRVLAAFAIVGLWWFFSSNELSYSKSSVDLPQTIETKGASKAGTEDKRISAVNDLGTIMPSMPEKEAKEVLGRASWRYFHTLLARFPDEPTEEQSAKLKQFIELYAELYPCGECSYHFVQTLKKYPPQVSSRTAAALWGCSIHNMVNEYLKKDKYDCSTILEDYDCGCGDDDGKIKDDLKMDKISLLKENKQGG
ncbi:hypothetical protein HG536_0B04030 [Torulaspora globosa]|uniref:Sulfhydryl oxidase n=1 Tax=Torulaspora globosa TaxID=48254 RepID=A0A7G3ZDF3_9SACH|nr:uncharacterized protein HG536_0B04030 [Torulaspora globosa]QLL31539.1 hypothetical protein HG536_0B04030 [Torulaspora globosa]